MFFSGCGWKYIFIYISISIYIYDTRFGTMLMLHRGMDNPFVSALFKDAAYAKLS